MFRLSRLAVAAAVAALAFPAQAATKITLVYTAVPSFLGAFVAKEQGYFDRRGLDVDLSLTANGGVIATALVADSAQIGGPTPTVILQANEGGLDLVVIAGCDVYPTSSRSGVVVGPSSSVKSAKDLVGKKVGVPGLNGIIDVLTKKWIQSAGIDFRRVNYVELTFPSMPDALKSGQVDAVSLVDPFYTRIVDSKLGDPIGDYGSIVPAGTMPIVYASTRSWAAKNAATVQAFRAALDDAKTYIDNPANQAAALDTLAKYTKLPPAVAATLKVPRNLVTRPDKEAFAFWVATAHEQGMITKAIDPASLIAP
jgi:NitT/TauT family transport system substrate-binding protein